MKFRSVKFSRVLSVWPLLLTLLSAAFIWRRFYSNDLAFIGVWDNLAHDFTNYLYQLIWQKQGIIPFWDPYIANGVSLVSTPLYRPFYLPVYLISLLPVEYLILGKNLLSIFHWLVFLISSYIFLRIYLIKTYRIFLALAILTLNISVFVYLGFGPAFYTLAYIPLILTLIFVVNEKNKLWVRAGIAVVFALQIFGGFIQITFYACILYAFFSLSLSNRWKRLLTVFVGCLIGLFLAGFQLAPLSAESMALHRPAVALSSVISEYRAPIEAFLRLFSPEALGSNFAEAKDKEVLQGSVHFYECLVGFSGFSTMFLTLFASFNGVRLSQKILWISLGVFILSVVYGSFTFNILHIIWGERLLLHGRFSVFLPFCFAFLSVYGLEEIVLAMKKNSKKLQLTLAILGILFLVVSFYEYFVYNTTYGLIICSAWLFFITLIFLLKIQDHSRSLATKVFIITIIFLELFIASEKLMNPNRSNEEVNLADDFPTTLSKEDFLMKIPVNHIDSSRLVIQKDISFYKHNYLPHRYEFKTINGYLNAFDKDLLRFFIVDPRTPHPLAKIERVLRPHETQYSMQRYFRIGYEFDTQGLKPIKAPPVAPRYFCADAIETTEQIKPMYKKLYKYSLARPSTLLKPGFIMASDQSKLKLENLSLKSDLKVRVLSESPNQLELLLNSSKPCLFVLNENYHPAWRATLRGREVEILRTNIIMRGLAIPDGESTLLFTFEFPAKGKAIAMTTLGICFLLFPFGLLFGKKRRRKLS